MPLTVSVVIPVFNVSEHLPSCLNALEKQTFPKSSYEVIVVDNGSTEDIRGLVSGFGRVVYVCERRPGSYVARNTGIGLARGEILAFTDADCIAADDWIEKGVICLTHTPKEGLVAGKVVLFFQNPDRPTAVELYESIFAFPQKEYVESQKFGATANIFTYKKMFESVGLFKAELKSGGDREWGRRVFNAGYSVVYADEVRVAHPARRTFGQLYSKTARVMEGLYDLKVANTRSTSKMIKGIIKDLLPPWYSISQAFSDSHLQGMSQKIRVVFVLICLGYMRAWSRVRLQFGRSL